MERRCSAWLKTVAATIHIANAQIANAAITANAHQVFHALADATATKNRENENGTTCAVFIVFSVFDTALQAKKSPTLGSFGEARRQRIENENCDTFQLITFCNKLKRQQKSEPPYTGNPLISSF